MSSRHWSLLPAVAALVAAACGGPGGDAAPRSDTPALSNAGAQSTVPSPVTPSPAVQDSASGQPTFSAQARA